MKFQQILLQFEGYRQKIVDNYGVTLLYAPAVLRHRDGCKSSGSK